MGSTDAVARPLSDEALRYLGRGGQARSYENGEAIVRRGQPGRALYVLLEGRAEVRMPSADGRHLPVCRLAPGATFGELSLLRGVPTTADVVAVGPVRVLLYPPDLLPIALGECAELRDRLLVQLAGHLERTTIEAWDQFLRAEALATLGDEDDGGGAWVVASPRMRAVDRELTRLAAGQLPVRIEGPAGCGKLTAARVLHRRSGASAGSLVVVDCRRLPAERAQVVLFGRSSEAGNVALGVPGALDLARRGTLVLRHAEALPDEVCDALADRLEHGTSDARLVLTSSAPPSPPDRLFGAISSRLEIAALAGRARDVLPLVDHFLDDAAADRRLQLTDDARRTLVSRSYGHRNVAELRDVIELAVRCADGDEIRPEHVFGSVGGSAPTVRGADLSRSTWLRLALGGRRLVLVKGLVAAGFVATIGLALAAPTSSAARAANLAVWGVWEPVTFVLFLLVGAVWCTVCPLSTVARLVQRWRSGGRAPDPWLRRWGVALSIAGLLAILWSARAFSMWRQPVATAVLLAVLLAAAILAALVYRREVWCRDLCPLGRLASVLAPAAPLAIAASPAVCSSACSDHPCFKGTDSRSGCTVYHHPVAAAEAHLCKLCLDCLQVCPHGSAALYARPPLATVWGRVADDAAGLPFAGALAALAPVLLAVGDPAAVGGRWVMLALGIMAVLVGGGGGVWLRRKLVGDDGAPVAGLAAAVAILGWGPLVAAALGAVPLLSDLRLTAMRGTIAAELLGAGAGVAPMVRTVVVAASLLAALVAAGRALGRAGVARSQRRLVTVVLAVVGAAGLLAAL